MEADPWKLIKRFSSELIIIGLGLVVFFNMLFNNFVWDDNTFIINNPEVHSLNLFVLFGNNLFNSATHYRPIPALYFALVYSLFGQQQFFYHFLQLVIHLINSLLVFIFLKKFLHKKLSLLLVLYFVIHPIQVETVSFIGATTDTLFFLFGMCSLLLAVQKKQQIFHHIIIFILLLLSILTKETGFLFAFIVLLFTFLFNKQYIRQSLVIFLGIIGFYLLIRFFIGGVVFEKLSLTPIMHLSFVERLITMPAVLFYYLKTFIFPAHLAIDQMWVVTKIDFLNFFLPLFWDMLFFGIVGLLGVYVFTKNKQQFLPFLLFFLWFALGIGIHLQLIPLDMTVADRFFYFPFVGLLGMIGITISKFKIKNSKLRMVCIMFVFFIISCLVIRTIIRNTIWQDEMTLYSHDSQVVDNFYLENNLGGVYLTQQNYVAAIAHYQKSVSLDPHEINLYNLGYAYEQTGNLQKAASYYQLALEYRIIPSTVDEFVFERLGWGLVRLDKFIQAEKILTTGIKSYPTKGSLWYLLAISEYQQGKRKTALISAKKALNFLPTEETRRVYSIIYSK